MDTRPKNEGCFWLTYSQYSSAAVFLTSDTLLNIELDEFAHWPSVWYGTSELDTLDNIAAVAFMAE